MKTIYQTDKGILHEEISEFVENPREFNEHDTTFLTWLTNSSSPDESEFHSMKEWIENMISKQCYNRAHEAFMAGDVNSGVEIVLDGLKRKDIVAMPVWKFQHTGVSYKAGFTNPFSCPWDSCFAGFIYIKKKRLYEIFHNKITKKFLEETVYPLFEAEVNEYSYYANGEVYDYTLENESGESEIICSFYGPIESNGVMIEFDITEVKEITEEEYEKLGVEIAMSQAVYQMELRNETFVYITDDYGNRIQHEFNWKKAGEYLLANKETCQMINEKYGILRMFIVMESLMTNLELTHGSEPEVFFTEATIGFLKTILYSITNR